MKNLNHVAGKKDFHSFIMTPSCLPFLYLNCLWTVVKKVLFNLWLLWPYVPVCFLLLDTIPASCPRWNVILKCKWGMYVSIWTSFEEKSKGAFEIEWWKPHCRTVPPQCVSEFNCWKLSLYGIHGSNFAAVLHHSNQWKLKPLLWIFGCAILLRLNRRSSLMKVCQTFLKFCL